MAAQQMQSQPQPQNPQQTGERQRNNLWLLVKGVTKPPINIQSEARRDANGNYLEGMKHDFVIVSSYIQRHRSEHLFNSIENMRSLKLSTVTDEFKEMCTEAVRNNYDALVVYYSGHGEKGTGDWCFADGTLNMDTLNRIRRSLAPNIRLLIVSDCCYSGDWAFKMLKNPGQYNGVCIWAASYPGAVAKDTQYGGAFTTWYCGSRGVPPMYWCLASLSIGNGVNGYMKYMQNNNECVHINIQ